MSCPPPRPTRRPPRPSAPVPRWRIGLLALLLALAGTAAAHGSVVLGAVTLTPDPPAAGKPLVITVELQSSSGAPVEGAKLTGALRPQDSSASATTLAFQEYPEPYGTYRASLTAPPAGSYRLSVEDHTGRGEATSAQVSLRVAGGAPNGSLDFTFPAASGGSPSLLRWLLWLIGVPLVVGVVVTLLVRRSRGREDSDPATDEGRG